MAQTLVNVPKKARRGDVIEIKTSDVAHHGDRISPHGGW